MFRWKLVQPAKIPSTTANVNDAVRIKAHGFDMEEIDVGRPIFVKRHDHKERAELMKASAAHAPMTKPARSG